MVENHKGMGEQAVNLGVGCVLAWLFCYAALRVLVGERWRRE